jgi:D-3-phosphoglycerate dehydrogenase
MSHLVVNTTFLPQNCINWLAQRVHLVKCDHRNKTELYQHLSEADGLVVGTYLNVNAELLDKASNLKVVGRAGAGIEHIDLDACRKRHIRVVYTPEANRQAVVEYVTALMLDALRPRPSIDTSVGPEQYLQIRSTDVGQQLDQLTLGILGFGGIGKRVGAVAHAIGMRVMANDLLPEEGLRQAVDYPCEFVDKTELYSMSDVLTIHVDGRSENRHLLAAEQLAQLKPSCLLINAARGIVLEPAALVEWAKQVAGQGGQAILDVVDPEPPGEDCPLLGLPNVRVLPHLAARTYTAVENMGWVARDVWAVLENEKPRFSAC